MDRPGARAGTRPCSYELAFDVAAHGGREGSDLVGKARVAPRPELLRIGAQDRQRRLQPVRQISGPCPCPGDGFFLRVEQVVDLGSKRPDLVGKVRSQPRCCARTDLREPTTHGVERAQADANLNPRRSNQDNGEEGERRNEIGGEGTARGMDLRTVQRHRGADGSPAEARRQGNPALDGQQRCAARAGDRVLVDLRIGEGIDRQVQRRIPERTGAQHNSIRLRDLPIEPAQGLEEPRLSRRSIDLKGTALRPGKAAHELVEIRAEFGRQATLYMPLEQEQQAKSSDYQGED